MSDITNLRKIVFSMKLKIDQINRMNDCFITGIKDNPTRLDMTMNIDIMHEKAKHYRARIIYW